MESKQEEKVDEFVDTATDFLEGLVEGVFSFVSRKMEARKEKADAQEADEDSQHGA